jgi:hypothetical protein
MEPFVEAILILLNGAVKRKFHPRPHATILKLQYLKIKYFLAYLNVV